MIYYQDNEIIIRDIIQEDVVQLFIWRLDKELNKHDPRPIPSNSKELAKEAIHFTEAFDTQIMCEDIDNRKYKYFIITNQEKQPIGFVNFFSIDKVKRQGEMGIAIGDKRYWNQGIAYKAASFVVDDIFKNMDIDRIYIETTETNEPAIRLSEKLGFQKCDEYIESCTFKFIVLEKKKETV